MSHKRSETESYVSELRLLIEEFCVDLLRCAHIAQDGIDPDEYRLERGVDIGHPDVFANIRVAVPGKPPYFVEVKYGYSTELLLQLLRRKYGTPTPQTQDATKGLLVVDASAHADWPSVEARIAKCLRPGLTLEVWNEQRLLAELRERFDVEARDLRYETWRSGACR